MATKMGRGFQVQNPCPPLKFLGIFWTFWAEEKHRLGVERPGISMTCPGLEAPIDSFITL